ncbi:hypothetical protein SBF1_380008 [Candidatus Desulfosporosinus infrequens]|uniref:Uncharacterized protein n=1 Tax=Candidatus Desulfosporosinus infrequens TaxID=2043169 RepID=A0A2U3L5I3_9FIRM|nr:hypothetical protein SBF1_380008 [Candidatus Desulfosporosinus infrequens]
MRFGLGMLMSFYLNDVSQPEMLELVVGIRSEEHYVNMMIAWYSLKNNSLLFVPPATAAEWRFICLLRK